MSSVDAQTEPESADVVAMDVVATRGAATWCPSCKASVPAGATWCSLCFTRLAQPTATATQEATEPKRLLPDEEAMELQRVLAEAAQVATSGALGPAAPALADPDAELWAQAKLAELAASGGAPTSRASLLLSDRRFRRTAAFGGMIAFAIVGVIVMAVLGHVV